MSDRAVDAGHDEVPDPLLLRNQLREFISKRLGKRGEADISLVIEAVQGVARTYARHDADRGQVMNYRGRYRRLALISAHAKSTADMIERLDVLSSDHLRAACGDVDMPKLIAELRVISLCSARVALTIQKTGKPRDVIEEAWIVSIGFIYRTFFGVGDRELNSADFQRFLRLCRPAQFRGGTGRDHGALTPRQIERALKRTAGKKKEQRLKLTG